ncbi:Ig-like domain-containing protein [Shewanella sp. KT0246]|uniref:Ig-like domain-containing protein n=1 Tax=Shewanella sp. KT0246 TaxID=2815912 RepID=UPI001BBD2885|nr:Ig-like domain-containing protein [Shewanella sp. KT0246]GIU51525.1 hypothetical protein TUM4249_16820 [Shewanella sp. KT0246]
MKRYFSFTLLAAAILSGCGSDSSPENEIEPIVNSAPQAFNDVALAQNNSVITIDVLANDTDQNNDELTITSITSMPTVGSAEVVNNQIIYTPENNVSHSDSITYEISDGELTAHAEVAITVNHTMTLSGLVTDSPIANALVSVTMGEDVFEVEADTSGNYTLPITVNDMSSLILINAKGNPTENQEGVELIAFVGQASNLLVLLDEDRALTNKENNKTNVTHLTTATYLLVKDNIENNEITSEEEFNQLLGSLTPSQLIETAGFIKLLVDNDDFEIPEGESVLSLLDAQLVEGENSTTSELIEAYLTENGYVDEDGETTEAYAVAISEAIEQTISDPNVVAQFTTENFSDQTIIGLFGAKQNWNEYQGIGKQFLANGTGKTFNTNNYIGNIAEINFTWDIVDGHLQVIYQDATSKSYDFIAYPYNELATDYNFEQSIIDELIAAHHAGFIEEFFNIEVNFGIANEKYVLLSSTSSQYQVNVTGEYYTQLNLPTTGYPWSNPTPRVLEPLSKSQILVHTPESALEEDSLTEMEGDWVLHFEDTFIDYNSLQEVTEVTGDVVTIKDTLATARNSNQQFNAALINGVLTLTDGAVQYRFTPLTSAGKGYLTQIEKWSNNKLDYVLARQIAKFDTSYEQYTKNIATELPMVQLSYINSNQESNWDGDKLKFSNVWGYIFNKDGTLNRGVSAVEPDHDSNDNDIGYFSLGDDRWTWDNSGRIVNHYLSTLQLERHRIWEVISVDDDGRALVYEHSTYGWDDNGDGVVEESETGQLIRPRINTFKLNDLSQWETEWQNTINLGLLGQSSNTEAKVTEAETKKRVNLNTH